jgi:hypothetical protein
MFHNTKLERLTNDKRSNLVGQFLSYEENEVLWIRTQENNSKIACSINYVIAFGWLLFLLAGVSKIINLLFFSLFGFLTSDKQSQIPWSILLTFYECKLRV